MLGLGLIAAAVVLALLTGAAYLGWQSGESLRTERIEQEQQMALQRQIDLARENLGQGNAQLALRRLNWVLERAPEYPDAQTLQAEAQAALVSPPTPTLQPDIAAGTPTPVATADIITVTDRPAGALDHLEALVEDEAWDDAIREITAFQLENPDYERRHTDQLLYDAYIGRGVDLLYGDRVEVGLYYLAQAEKLGDLPTDVRDQRTWADLYLSGIGYYGVNWDVTVFYFRDLCAAAPFFQNSCEKLFAALVAYGDQYAFQQDWCPAETLYAEAYRLDNTSTVSDKLGEARDGCLSATPTPAAPVTGTLPVTGTTPFTDTAPAGGWPPLPIPGPDQP